MRLRAEVRLATGATRHAFGIVVGDQLQFVPAKAPQSLEIVQAADGSCLLLRLDENSKCVADTWHEGAQSAKGQAEMEYGVLDEDWAVVNEVH